MTVGQSIFLGVVQGLTEFLPVSSDGHLVIVQEGFGLRPDNAIAFDVLLHMGTLVAVVGYFFRDLLDMALALFGAHGEAMVVKRRWVWLLAFGTLPVSIVGLALEDWFAETFQSLIWAGGGLLVTGTMLALVSGKGSQGRGEAQISYGDAFRIGAIQSFALLPGVSRSASTLFCALSTGVERTTAARFSFMLSIPAIVGALVLKGSAVLEMARNGDTAVLVAGPVAAAVTGWFAIDVLMRAVRKGSLLPFAVYCWSVGTLVLVWSLSSGFRG